MTGDSHSKSNDLIGRQLPWLAIILVFTLTGGSPAVAQQRQQEKLERPPAAAPAEDEQMPAEDEQPPAEDEQTPAEEAPVIRAIRIGPDLTAQPADPSPPGDEVEVPLAAESTERPPAVISLINGNTIAGQLRAADTGDVIRWQGDDFTEPFDLRLDAVKSVKLPAADQRVKMTGEFAIETASGDLLSGELLRWTEDSIEIKSPRFGTVTLDAADLRRLYRIEKNPTLIFSSLAGLRDWEMPEGSADLWKEDGAHIWTDKPGAIIEADLGVPEKAHLDFTLSWTDKPNFVFGLAVDANAGAEQRTDGWRFEVIAEALAIVREDQDGADIAMVEGLQNKKSTRLHAYLDQNRGELHVYRPNGELLAEISLPTVLDQQDDDSRFGRAVRLIHNEGGLRLERLRISRWSGILPVGTSTPQVVATLADGTIMSAQRVQIDSEQQALVLQSSDGEVTVPLESIMVVKRTQLSDEVPEPPTSLFMHDGSRISGELLAITDEEWLVGSAEFIEPVAVPRTDVRTFIVLQRDPVPADPNREGRSGRLVIGEHSLTGRLVDATEQSDAGVSCFRWLPFGATGAGSLKLDVSGKIIYRDPPPRPAAPSVNRAVQALQVRRQQVEQQNRGLNFGKLFLERADSVPAARPAGPDAHRVHVRSGDVIPGLVDSIDSRGVRLTTAQSNEALIAHHKVKAIELRTDEPPPSLQEAKRKRLLTLPRLQKNSPPTHLLVATTGDFLRCRLIEMRDQVIRVELQLEEVEIPRDRVSQIIWLHPEELLAELADDDPQADEESRSPFRQLAQLIRQDGKRITLDPQQVDGQFIAGTSDVLGDCRFEIAEIDQLIFGEAIREAVSVLAYNQWQLEPAVEPLMARDLPGGAEVGSESALIGTDAPPIKLDLLDGGQFVLAECKGQIVVLDFWATWCAPCMQTMPLVEEALARFDPAQVRLVSVNLEERPDHIESVLERHEMDLTVALDIDGVAARRYQARAIPQLVIVDREGKVARLYVGGGSQMVEEMTAAIEELLQEQGI